MKATKKRNPVAHFINRYNKPSIQTDKKKALKQGALKHKKQAYQQAA